MPPRAAIVATLMAIAAAPAGAAPAAYDIAFVAEFEKACVPQRLSYSGTVEAAKAAGWREVERAAHPELDALMAKSEEAATDPELKATFAYETLTKSISGTEHYLVVSRSTFIIGEEDDPLNPWVHIGCYLYNFEATAPLDPEPVSALLEKPIAHSHADATLTGHVWGPPCPMPRTGDTYLTFVPEGSPYAERTGFSGLVLKFSTSEPDPGEEVPETYC